MCSGRVFEKYYVRESWNQIWILKASLETMCRVVWKGERRKKKNSLEQVRKFLTDSRQTMNRDWTKVVAIGMEKIWSIFQKSNKQDLKTCDYAILWWCKELFGRGKHWKELWNAIQKRKACMRAKDKRLGFIDVDFNVSM